MCGFSPQPIFFILPKWERNWPFTTNCTTSSSLHGCASRQRCACWGEVGVGIINGSASTPPLTPLRIPPRNVCACMHALQHTHAQNDCANVPRLRSVAKKRFFSYFCCCAKRGGRSGRRNDSWVRQKDGGWTSATTSGRGKRRISLKRCKAVSILLGPLLT